MGFEIAMPRSVSWPFLRMAISQESHTGIGDEHVYPAKILNDLGNRLLNIFGIRYYKFRVRTTACITNVDKYR